MFSLIITIISIALVAILALATLYYGGSALNQGSAKATAAKLVNEGQQINGAYEAINAEIGAGNSTLTLPASGDAVNATTFASYLSAAPSGTWTVAGTYAHATAGSADVCSKVNDRAGFDGSKLDSGVFGCDTASKTVFFKL